MVAEVTEVVAMVVAELMVQVAKAAADPNQLVVDAALLVAVVAPTNASFKLVGRLFYPRQFSLRMIFY
jgi:hypothetical protein